MTERFGESYRAFARTRGAFLPGSPVSRLFERVFGFIGATWLRWTVAYVSCMAVAFAAAFALLAYTRSHTALVWLPDHRAVAISVWPKSEAWISEIFQTALDDEGVRGRIAAVREDKPLVVTILPPRYSMTGMYYVLDRGTAGGNAAPARKIDLDWLMREAVYLLLPIEPFARKYYLGIDPDGAHEPVEVVFSRADKPYKSGLGLEEVLDPGVRLTPLVIADVLPGTSWVTDVRIPLPRNRWGTDVLMPIF